MFIAFLQMVEKEEIFKLLKQAESIYKFIDSVLNLAVQFGFLVRNVKFIFLENSPSGSIGIWNNIYQNNK